MNSGDRRNRESLRRRRRCERVDIGAGSARTTTRTAECVGAFPSVVQSGASRRPGRTTPIGSRKPGSEHSSGAPAVRNANPIGGRISRSAGERWGPLAHHLADRFAAPGGSDEGMVRTAVAVILGAARRRGSRRPALAPRVLPRGPKVVREQRRWWAGTHPGSLGGPPGDSRITPCREPPARNESPRWEPWPRTV